MEEKSLWAYFRPGGLRYDIKVTVHKRKTKYKLDFIDNNNDDKTFGFKRHSYKNEKASHGLWEKIREAGNDRW